MQTKVVKIDPFQIDENEMKKAAELIQKRRTGSVSNRDRIWSGCRCAASGSIKKDICGKGTAIRQSPDRAYLQI